MGQYVSIAVNNEGAHILTLERHVTEAGWHFCAQVAYCSTETNGHSILEQDCFGGLDPDLQVVGLAMLSTLMFHGPRETKG